MTKLTNAPAKTLITKRNVARTTVDQRASTRQPRVDNGEAVIRSSAAKRRAIIPTNGYYECMKSEAGSKISYFLHGEGDVLAMAGLYELCPDPELPENDPNKWLWTCTVLARPVIYPSNNIVVMFGRG